jgi:signal transduction histidine kinase
LAVAIRTHVSDEVRQGPVITLDLQNDQGVLSQGAAISLFRIYQEAVLNAIRHSEADQVTVRLEMGTETCTLSVRDNGRGFVRPARLDELVQQRHFGLAGMQERAEALGGRLEVKSTPGAGTEITVRVPVAAQPVGEQGN